MAIVDVVQDAVERRIFVDCKEFSKEQSRCHLDWNIEPISGYNFRARLGLREFGDVVFAEVEHEPIAGSRHIGDINRRNNRFIGLTLFTTGSLAFSQGGSELLVHPQEMLLWDGTRPGSLRSWATVECKTILFPRALVYQHIGNIEDIAGQKLGLDSGTGQLLKSHIDTLHRTIGFIAPRDRLSVLRATLDMIAACFRPCIAEFSGSQHHKAIFRQIEKFMRDTLLDPTINLTAIAKAFGFTPRYLSHIFAEAGTTFSEWVRKERLSRAEMALTSNSFAAESITTIAHRFGFCDAAHFSNLFKARYGKPPKAYRVAALEHENGIPFKFREGLS